MSLSTVMSTPTPLLVLMRVRPLSDWHARPVTVTVSKSPSTVPDPEISGMIVPFVTDLVSVIVSDPFKAIDPDTEIGALDVGSN